MSLQIANRMYIVTSSGEREIQLCVGDITALPNDEKMDVIMVSALPNNYSPTSGSVIGALKRNLNLNVEDLAYNHKKEDLRQNFHCWVSKELPEHLPYRQLICFEQFRNQRAGQHLDIAVKDVFRAMMPVFNNENKSVITSLLGTGTQVAQKSKMLRGMLNSAIEWMKFGLPLQLLRIVIYQESSETMSQLRALFDEIKARAELDRRPPKEPPRKHDFFLIYSKDDEEIANEMKNFLTAAKKRFMKYLGPANIVTASDVVSKKSSWQHDVMMEMLASTSVVPILTTSFMSNPECLDQYNLGLCANRRTQRALLAPFCLDSISDMPIYMTLVQWFNCKPRDSVKIQNSCIVLMEQMKESFENVKLEYEIFVSYCHRNLDKAKVFVNSLKRENSNTRIFFDQDELKTGQSWQQALYQALDNSKCVVALISNDYLESLVCNEELNIASAKHLSTAKSQELILIQLEPTKKISLFDYVTPIAAERNFDQVSRAISASVNNWLKEGMKDSTFSPVQYPLDIQDLVEKWRRQDLESNYFLSQDGIYLNDMAFDVTNSKSVRNNELVLYGQQSSEKAVNDIFISYSLQDRKYASFLAWSLARSPSNFSICSLSSSEANDTAQIDLARCVVVLLSLQYHRNSKKVEEFNYILSRVRKHRVIYVVFVDVLPTRPWYMRVVHCSSALTDDFWPDALASLTNSSKDGMIFSPQLNSAKAKIEKLHGPLLSREILALLKATCDIENICLAVRNGKQPSIQLQKGIFFNITDLKRSIDTRGTHKREFTIIANDYNKHSINHDNKEHNNHRKISQPIDMSNERTMAASTEQTNEVAEPNDYHDSEPIMEDHNGGRSKSPVAYRDSNSPTQRNYSSDHKASYTQEISRASPDHEVPYNQDNSRASPNHRVTTRTILDHNQDNSRAISDYSEYNQQQPVVQDEKDYSRASPRNNRPIHLTHGSYNQDNSSGRPYHDNPYPQQQHPNDYVSMQNNKGKKSRTCTVL